MKAREVKRAKLVARYAEKRAALKKIIATADVNTEEGAMAAYEAARKLQEIPRNANPIRLHNRCKITGRPKGYMRQFGLSRIQFREMASSGLIPGNELFPIVDEDGNVLGSILRGEAHDGRKVLHPVVHLHLFNSRGELYLQRRPDWKPIQPGKWDTAVGGHISYGETVKEAFQREVMEELGIKVENAGKQMYIIHDKEVSHIDIY